MTIKNHERWVVATRPTLTSDGKDIPEDYLIYNAPRPLRGSIDWIGDFISGVFYAASPQTDIGAYWTNINLDAVILKYASEEDIRKFVDTVLVTEYPEVAKLDFEEYREYFEDKFFFYYNFGDL